MLVGVVGIWDLKERFLMVIFQAGVLVLIAGIRD